MTKEEAIEDLLRHYTGESTDVAIKAIKQSSAFDKIESEIRNERNMDYKCHRKTYDNCLRIIDKYKADMESEE